MSAFVAAAAAAQMLYAANVASFGCGSADEVARLQHLRSDQTAFQNELMRQIFYGQCVSIARGKRVIGAAADANSSLLLIDRRLVPPGYLAPRRDFTAVAVKAKK